MNTLSTTYKHMYFLIIIESIFTKISSFEKISYLLTKISTIYFKKKIYEYE